MIPFGFFWPISSMNDFYGQWNNVSLCRTGAIAMAATNLTNSAPKE